MKRESIQIAEHGLQQLNQEVDFSVNIFYKTCLVLVNFEKVSPIHLRQRDQTWRPAISLHIHHSS
jgi:hypothetical protein